MTLVLLSSLLLQPLAQWCRLLPKDAAKMPESTWKLVFYTMSWSYSTYLLFFTSYSFFHDPPSVFYNWKSGMPVPTDIAIAYLIQGSFYGHSIYATVYMDAWRKDSAVMVVHHIITLALICFSYAFRYHNVGILVLFLHDINDIQLEFTKLNVYLKSRGGGYYLLNDILSNMGSVSFSITWFWFRLYWFPLKVLYATCVSSLQSVPNIPFYFFFNTLLLALLLMNIYWFLFIVIFVVKVLKMKEVNDVREYEDEDGNKTAVGQHRKPQAANDNDDAGHHHSAQGQDHSLTFCGLSLPMQEACAERGHQGETSITGSPSPPPGTRLQVRARQDASLRRLTLSTFDVVFLDILEVASEVILQSGHHVAVFVHQLGGSWLR
ncbi:hypothetical protein INR49_019557, partial [Caranx melampygus]